MICGSSMYFMTQNTTLLTCFKDLWRSCCCLGEVEGFDHSVVNTTLGACGELPAPREGPCLPFPIWQCGEIKVIDAHKIDERMTITALILI